MNSPAVDIANLLAANGFGTYASTIFASRVPDSPDVVMVVSSVTAREPMLATGKTAGTFLDTARPNVQVWLRDKAGQNAAGYNRAAAVRKFLHGKSSFIVNGTRYHSVFALSDIGELGVDEKLRPVFSINFRMERSMT